ncbi:MAG: DUF4340 domain-containing protein [Candidatus Zixiibacteriota bacterium]
MTETKKTLYFIGIAVALALIAFWVTPQRITPSAFLDQGESFYPDFTDPNAATTLEIISFNEDIGEAHPFKVTFKNGRWTLPSHHDYPADAKDRLAKTAAGIIELRKDDFRSDNIADQAICGVVDPLDETYDGLTGRGQRVTLKDKNDNVLSDLIFGKPVEENPGYRFVRIPDSKRIYAAKTQLVLTDNFSDWINTDLLEVNKGDIDRLTILDYSIDERTRRLNQRDEVRLQREGASWKARKMSAGQTVDSMKIGDMLTTLDNLKIVGVRPKPAGVSASLKQSGDNSQLNRSDLVSLQSKGFFFTSDGDLKSNEGELLVETSDGILYTLRFGEIFYGSGLEVSAGAEGDGKNAEGAAENRYLFLTTEFNSGRFPEPPKPKNLDFENKPDSLLTDADKEQRRIQREHERWERKIEMGKTKSTELNNRFADWYFVIPADSFDKLRLDRSDILIKK